MTALLEKVFSQVSALPETEQEVFAARLLHTLEEFAQEKSKTETKPRPRFGSAKGMGCMTADIEDPLDEFIEYIERLCF